MIDEVADDEAEVELRSTGGEIPMSRQEEEQGQSAPEKPSPQVTASITAAFAGSLGGLCDRRMDLADHPHEPAFGD